jgi:hypothetical protein
VKKIYTFIFGLIVGAILTIIFFPHPKIKPGLIKSNGHLSGMVEICPDSGQNPPETMGTYEFTLPQKPTLKTPKKTALAPGEYKVPVTGELVTNSNLGKVTMKINGVTTVTIGLDDLKVDTLFSGVSTLKASTEKNWQIYAGVKSDYTNIYPVLGIGYQKVIRNFYYNISGEIGKNRDNITSELCLKVGIMF